ncbi:MAG: cupin domain-containing protein [Opitutaceae bacterium]|nr:cupin domain-containing protein [Opitutaceae bacterium]
MSSIARNKPRVDRERTSPSAGPLPGSSASVRSPARLPGVAEIHIARRLAALRKENRLTLREVSERSGISAAYLNRVERQKTPINIANLEKLAAAFGVSLTSFFEANDGDSPLVVTRAGQGRKVRFRGRKGFRVELLAEDKKGKLLEPLLVDLSSAKSQVALQSHPGQEFNYVIEGRCVFIYGKERMELGAGDSVYFDAMVPHVCRAIAPTPTRMLAIVASRDYPLHGNISVLLDEPQR